MERDHIVNFFSEDAKDQIGALTRRFARLESLREGTIVQLKQIQEELPEPVVGAIVMKKVCCHKSACSRCKGKENAHGPYPHLVWKENGVNKSRYLSRKNYPIVFEQVRLTNRQSECLARLVRIETQMQQVQTTLSAVNVHLHGKAVNKDA